jgi:endonuclease-3 related protein
MYQILHTRFGPQGWWPADDGKLREWEVCVGAILTQNTNWKNVEKAIASLKEERALHPKKLSSLPITKIERLVKSSGFYRQKAQRLKKLSEFVLSFGSLEAFAALAARQDLLSLDGIGKETADSILLYACGKPYFVIDSYTRRIMSRIGMITGDEDYDDIRYFFESSLPKEAKMFSEFHALLVELAKRHCKKEPECNNCPLLKMCKFGKKTTSQ